MSELRSMRDLVAGTQGETDPARTQRGQRELAIALQPEPGAPRHLSRRLGTVTAVNVGPPLTADVFVGGTIYPGLSPQSTYRPIVDDRVWVEMMGTDAQISPPVTTDANRKWNALPLNTADGWVLPVPASDFADPGYWRDANGIVRLRGCTRLGAAGTVIGTLPAGFRPAPGASAGFTLLTLNAALTYASAGVLVQTGGAIVHVFGATAPTVLWLDSVRFRVD